MGFNGQAQCTINKKKWKFHKKKRAEIRNSKKVSSIDTPKKQVLRAPRTSKKKLRKDAKRRKIYVEAEKAKLLKSGLITQEDIDKMEAEGGDASDDDSAEAMDAEN